MTSSLAGALRLSSDVSGRMLPGSQQSGPSGSSGIADSDQGGALDDSAGSQYGLGLRSSSLSSSADPAGRDFATGARSADTAAASDGSFGNINVTIPAPRGDLVAGRSGGVSSSQPQLGSQFAADAAQATMVSASATDRARTNNGPAVSGLQPGAWSGSRRSTPGYMSWQYGSSASDEGYSQGGVDLGGLARPRYPTLPSTLRFRYVSSPLWWSSAVPDDNPGRGFLASTSAQGNDESHQGMTRRNLATGLRAANSAAVIWRSIFVGPSGDDSGGMDRSWDQTANGMSGLSARTESASAGIAGAALVGSTSAPNSAGPETVYIAMDQQGRAGTTTSSASRLTPVEMSIVAALPAAPPPAESLTSGGSDGAAQPHARGRKAQAQAHKDDSVSHSKIEGSVDAVAQRIYHRIRRRIANDRERFGG